MSAGDVGAAPVSAFYLDVDLVTNADFGKFVRATGALPPDWWVGREPPVAVADHPVTGVTVDEARAYATWRGKRLPTSAEWVLALRGREGRRLPWGDACDPARCVCPRSGAADDTVAVGARPGDRSPDGVRDLLGNVWEWTEPSDGLSPDEAGYHYVFGGSYRHACGALDREVPHTVVNAFAAYRYLGFRCAWSPS